MARIDSLLRLMVAQDGDELRLTVGREPSLTKKGNPLRLFFPSVSDLMYEQLTSELLTPELRARCKHHHRAAFRHSIPGLAELDGMFLGVEARELWMGRGSRPPAATIDPSAAPLPAPPSPPSVAAPEPAAPPILAPTDGDSPWTVSRSVLPQAPAAPDTVAMEDFPEAPIAPELPPPPPREAAPYREPQRYREPLPPAPPSPPIKPSSLIPQALAALALKAAECGASDLHLTLGEVPTVRVERRLRALPDAEPFEESRLIEDLLPPDASSVDLAFDTPSGQRLRVHAFRYEHGVGAAIRLMPGSPRPLSRLGLPVALDDLARLSHGLVLLGGPAGSGKTTTMLALTREVLRVRGGVCITLESPIEIPLEAPSASAIVRQRLVGRDVPDMATGLREALREDPDLLVLGELRDPEAILLALSAAETGHLVFATLHCRSAPSAVERVLDAVPPARQAQARGQLAESLRAVVVQRLLPRADGTGFAIAVEVMRGTRAVASLIRDGKTGQLSSAVQTGAAEGMHPLERTLAQLVEQGRISRDAALAACNDTDSMRRMFI